MSADERTADVDFYWDPMCPWAWITSRWVIDVAQQRDLTVDWRFISLRLLNEHKNYQTDFPAGYVEGHGSGLKLLRVASAIRNAEGPARMQALYTQFGGDVHVRGRRSEIVDHYEAGFPDYLRSVGIEERYLGAANDASLDEEIRASKDEALSRAGKDVGTPIICFRRGEHLGAFFGPVISRVPRGEEALRLWDAIWEIATFPGFAELKRSLRERPQLADSLG